MLHHLFKHRFTPVVLEQIARLPGSPDKDLERADDESLLTLGPKITRASMLSLAHRVFSK
jgi:hypothetical protein